MALGARGRGDPIIRLGCLLGHLVPRIALLLMGLHLPVRLHYCFLLVPVFHLLDSFLPLKLPMDPAGPPPMISLLLLVGRCGAPGKAPEGEAALRVHRTGHR